MAESNAAKIKTVLHDNWSLQSPSVDDILWADTRVDAATFLASVKNYAVCCYNPMSPTSVEPLSREVWQITERVMVDIYVKVVTTIGAAVDVRENMKAEVYRILHQKQLDVSGIQLVNVERETNKLEASDLVRLTLQVTCVTFHQT